MIFKRDQIMRGAPSRWSFGPNSAWSSIETMAIGKTHPTLFVKTMPLYPYSAGKWTAVTGVSISDFSREKLTATANELEEEKKFAFEFLKIA